MRTNIWIPKDIKKEMLESAKKATDSGGLGAYFVKLHKEDKRQKRKERK